jgi:23S rRNA (adenine2503-C2)-methyltransferase
MNSANEPGRVNFFDLNQDGLREYFTELGEKSYRATQIMKWIYYQGITDVTKMTDLGKDLRQKLDVCSDVYLPEIIMESESTDGTIKWLMKVRNGNSVETVFIPEENRGTLCISSQVGCPLDCSFCSTGKQGFNSNLSIAEIIGQLWLANQRLGFFNNRHKRIITNVVMMGMGEPLLNFDNVMPAIQIMTDDLGFNLARKRVTLSTSGIVPGIYKLAEISDISLAISLHAANNELRNILVPINKSYPLEELLEACRHYSRATNNEVITFEYVMLNGVNDSKADARQMAKILKGIPAKINLIPFNSFPGSEYRRSSDKIIDQFRDILVNAGLVTITRKTRGDDIDAACGQLVGKVNPKAMRHQNLPMEGLV